MTTIKIADRASTIVRVVEVMTRDDLAEGELRDAQAPGSASPILLSAYDGDESTDVWLSTSQAREVIAALQAAVDEVEPRPTIVAAAVFDYAVPDAALPGIAAKLARREYDRVNARCACVGASAYECAHCSERRCMECDKPSTSESVKTAVRFCPAHREAGQAGWLERVLPPRER